MKRKRSSEQAKDEDDSISPLSHSVPQNRPPKRPRRDAPSIPTFQKPLNRIKRELRDVTRILEHSKDLPADVRVEKERALAGYRLDLQKAEREKRRQQMIKKYHMVRFFERQKATRKLKRIKNLLSKTSRGSAEHVDLDDKVHRAEVDLNYTLYCPLDEKYTSLYKGKDTQTDPDHTMADNSKISQGSQSDGPRPVMWAVVEQCMAENTLQALREGKLEVRLPGVPNGSRQAITATDARSSQRKKTKTSGKKHSEDGSKDRLVEAHALDSDGGFFEE